MFRLPVCPPGTAKICLHIYEPKGANRIEMLPRAEIDLQGKPDLITFHAYDHNSRLLLSRAFEEDWVEYDAERHRPENFRRVETKPASIVDHSPPYSPQKPIPKAGLDSVHEEGTPSPNGGKVIAARVSNHVEPKQSTAPLAPKPAPPAPKPAPPAPKPALTPEPKPAPKPAPAPYRRRKPDPDPKPALTPEPKPAPEPAPKPDVEAKD